MPQTGHPYARRTVLKGASLFGASVGLGGVLAAGFAQDTQAQGTAAVQPSMAEIWSGEYWAKKDGVPLYLYRKRMSAPKIGEPPLPVLFLVHGSSISSRSTFDLAVPGRGEYSLMNKFAEYGFDVWTMDHENYGRSGRTEGNSDIKSGAEDLKVATELVSKETGRQKLHFCGESSGALRASVYAMMQPERIDRLVLLAHTYKGEGSSTLSKRAEQVAYFRTHNRRPRDRAMIQSILTRDKPGTSDPAVGDAIADAELKFGDQAPTGTYLDMTTNLPVVDPAKILCPTLVLRGEHDGIATVEDLFDFYKQLPNGDRQFVTLPGVAHSLVFAINRHLFWHVMREFLSMPAPLAT
jgi:alpha-beta hydrolase superfamily lysophospholipase